MLLCDRTLLWIFYHFPSFLCCITLFFSLHDKIPWPNATCEEKRLFGLIFMAMVHHWQKSGQELRQDWNRNHWRLGLPDSLLSLVLGQLFYVTQNHLPRDGNTHSGQDPLQKDQNTTPQIRWQANLTWAIGPWDFFLPKTLGCIKLITKINQDNEFTSHR